MDEGGRITEFNRAAEHAFGFTRAEVLGRDLFDTIIPRSIRLGEAPSFGLPITKYAPTSVGAKVYRSLALELIGKENA